MSLVPKQLETKQQLIAPGDTEQVSFQATDNGIVKGVVVGPGAQAVKLYVGKERFEIPAEGDWSVDFPMKPGQYVMVTVKNTMEEPGVFSAMFQLEVEEEAKPVVKPEVAALSRKLPPDITTTAADLGVKAGKNEVAVCFTRNEVNFLLDSLRTGGPLFPDVKFTIIRRLDAVMKAK